MGLISEITLRVRVLRYRMGLRKTLPAAAINRVKIAESGEAMVNIRQSSRLFFGPSLESRDCVFVRSGVYERLIKAADLLPGEYRLKIMSAYRSLAQQHELWNLRLAQTREKHPHATEEELIAITRGLVAQPHHGFGGHQTGGAIDVTLCDETGADLGLGKWTPKDVVISLQEQMRRRDVLRVAMCAAGFVNYPAEWWHFCYGDRMWAAYTRRSKCFYGLVEKVK